MSATGQVLTGQVKPDQIQQNQFRDSRVPNDQATNGQAATGQATKGQPPKVPVSKLSELLAVTEHLRNAAKVNKRQNLVTRLDAVEKALNNKRVDIVVVGQFKQGKSALVNALVDSPVCPVDDVIATSIPTVVKWGKEISASLVTELVDQKKRIHNKINPFQLRSHVTELAGETGFLGSVHAEVTLPRPVLADGITIIDTPGVGRSQARASTNLMLLPQADAALIVSDATQELTSPELNFINQAKTLCNRISCVISKTDLQHDWRSIIEANRGHLSEMDVEVALLPTSALLYDLSKQSSDKALERESHIKDLVLYLQNNIQQNVLKDRYRTIGKDICSIAEHLAMVFEAELSAIKSGTGGNELVRSLEEAEKNAGKLSKRSSKWQQTLSDGIGDLISDIEFDLRDRLRKVGRDAEKLIDDCDPGKVWNDIGTWLAESVTQAVSDNFVWSHKRSEHLSEVVAQHFTLEGQAAMPDLPVATTDKALEAVGGLDVVLPGRLSIGQKVMIGMKGSYGGILMFGLMTTLAGMALVNPLSIAAGLIVGSFAYKRDAKQRLDQRRNEAKVAVRKLIDEAIFQVGKESRDRMHRVRRTLRDHYLLVAEDLKLSLNESIHLAKSGSKMPVNARATRSAQLTKQIKQIHQLVARVNYLNQPARPEPLATLERRTA